MEDSQPTTPTASISLTSLRQAEEQFSRQEQEILTLRSLLQQQQQQQAALQDALWAHPANVPTTTSDSGVQLIVQRLSDLVLSSQQQTRDILTRLDTKTETKLDKAFAKPDKFDGDLTDSSESMLKAQAWLHQVDTFISVASIPEALQVKVVTSYLSGAAAQWWSALLHSGTNPLTFSEFRRCFSQTYLKDEAQMVAEAVVKLKNLRQGPNENMQEYTRRFAHIMCWLSDRRNHITTREQFIAGLHLDLRRWLKMQDYDRVSAWTLDELIANLSKYDARERADLLSPKAERDNALHLASKLSKSRYNNNDKSNNSGFNQQPSSSSSQHVPMDFDAMTVDQLKERLKSEISKNSNDKGNKSQAQFPKKNIDWRLKSQELKDRYKDGCFIHETKGHKLKDCRVYQAAQADSGSKNSEAALPPSRG